MTDLSSPLAPMRHLGVSLSRRAFALVDRLLIPDADALSLEELRRRRLLALSTAFVVFFSFFVGSQAYAVAGQIDAVASVLWGGGALGLGTLALLRSPSLAHTAAPLLCLETLAVLAVVALVPGGQGLWDPSVWWLTVVPVLAALLVGPRFSLLCAVAISVHLAVLYADADVRPPPMGPNASWFRLLSGITVVLALAGLAWLYELSRRDATALVERTLNELTEANARLKAMNANTSERRDVVEADNQRKTQFLTRMRANAKATRLALDDTSAALADMTRTFHVIAESVATLAEAALESASAIQQMNATNQSAGERIYEMVESVDHAAMSLEEMGYSVQEVAQHVQSLEAVAEATSTSMNEMEVSVSHVQENALAAERLAEEVIVDARRGAEAVQHTVDGMQNISKSSSLAGGRMRRLGGRIEDIGAILHVISDVAEQTHLLSLNAAIIASQAGEHGRGFSVVASEIKKLAERTASSTQEIGAVIRSVQEESREAVQAIEEGERAIDDGLRRSRDAEAALAEILRSAEETTRTVKAIAAATIEQHTAARGVAEEMNRVAMNVSQVAMVTSEQSSSAGELLNAARRMQELAIGVAQSSQEQLEGGQRVESAVRRIQDRVSALEQVQADQARGSEQILESIEAIRKSQGAQVNAIADAETAPV